MMNAIEIKDTELNEVNGGTIFPNDYDEEVYHKYGIKTKYHWFEPDEFWLPNGRKTGHYEANWWVELCRKYEEQESGWKWEYHYKGILS